MSDRNGTQEQPPSDAIVPPVTSPVEFSRIAHRVTLLDATRSRFDHDFFLRNASSRTECDFEFPVEYDWPKGCQEWHQLLRPDSIFTVEDRRRPVPFVPRVVTDRPKRLYGSFTLRALFYTDRRFDRLHFGYETNGIFPDTKAGMDCVFVDIFAETDVVSLQVLGTSFPVALKPTSEAGSPFPQYCTAVVMNGCYEGAECAAESARATDRIDGKIWADAGVVYWTLTRPTVGVRYKIYFIADPTAVCGTLPGEPVGAYEVEVDRLFALHQNGGLNSYLGRFILAADGRILDHNDDAFRLRDRAEEVARLNRVPIDHIVEYFVPPLD